MASQTLPQVSSQTICSASRNFKQRDSTSARFQPDLKASFVGKCVSLNTRAQKFTASSKNCVTYATSTLEKLGTDVANNTFYPKAEDHLQVNKPWYIIDAKGQTLGRLAVLVSQHLRGANVPTYTPSVDMGGYVVVINAEQVVVSGNKTQQKLYRRHTTGLPGAMKVETFAQVQKRIPARIIEKAVKGMLPKGSLGRTLFKHMKVVAGPTHEHEAQQPVDITDQINRSFTRLSPTN
mmetsp:Transcript_17724/g.24498  ORF Transcript_17724/g.24498 Transcript_17724/m.24498 type:complete len:236 (-) Transcript_17724:174-881(-)|eukprot:CAMPEP_0196579184 /NCGR_PEP_ID=MMETSP1081-20130531/18218_1 /TAXON_ID=36882 /ORGANISM="Pyramimonas amylifera, Strain CCMP720" /LENGTH=235 /DNA_ID=CAMNT_0041898661 /DNA_START=92 /DNA_END=799 /DNA_ORIENTATION=-